MKTNLLQYLMSTSFKRPENIAVEEQSYSVSFADLVHEAFHLSLKILAVFPYKNQPVVFILPKSSNSIITIVAILMSGNIYCPIDINAPLDRINKILTNLDSCLIICNESSKEIVNEFDLPLGKYPIINIDSFCTSDQPECTDIRKIWDVVDVNIKNTVDVDPCYIIFTSGSTGIPKGVTISHSNVIDYIEWANSVYNIQQDDKIGSQAPFFFDNSTLDIYLSFSNGATLHLIPEAMFIFPQKLIEHLNQHSITTIFWVPSLLATIANFKLLEKNTIPKLKNILFAGEVMPAKSIKYWLKHHPNALYSNLYGPTEITVDCTYFNVPANWDGETLPIGIPCQNSDIIILDDEDELSSQGELCVRGRGVALGYWADPGKTEQVFCQSPLHNNYRDIIYRTGDLVRTENNLIYFIGRKDHQIKHNGYRIELGEIETIVSEISNIDNIIASYIEEKKILCITVTLNTEITAREIKKLLSSKLPKYMIPNEICILSDLPLTPNGKYDRKKIKQLIEENIKE